MTSNTGQVLTSMSEIVLNDNQSDKFDALPLLEEAFQLFEKCLDVQQGQLTLQNETVTAVFNIPETSPLPMDPKPGDGLVGGRAAEDEQWASIVEPLTSNVLVDTIIAEIQCLISMLSIPYIPDASFVMKIDSLARLVLRRADSIIQQIQTESTLVIDPVTVPLARGNYKAAFADASFRAGQLSMYDYFTTITTAYDFSVESSPQVLCDLAEAYLNFATTISAALEGFLPQSQRPEPDFPLASTRWKSISGALDALTKASKFPSTDTNELTLSLSAIHARRADCELLRARLAEPSNGSHGPAAKSLLVLRKNAETYYRGAAKMAITETGHENVDLNVREAVCAALNGNTQVWKDLYVRSANVVQKVVVEMREEFLIDEDIQHSLERVLSES